MSYGIPEYRINRAMLKRLEDLVSGFKIKTILNTYLNEENILKLKDQHDYLIIAVGLGKSRNLNIGASNRIIPASRLLREYNLKTKYNEGSLPNIGGRVIVVGAGNVAMDAARVAKRLGASVSVYYRRSRLEAPATKEEIMLAENEGIEFNFLVNPVEARDKENHLSVKMNVMTLGEADSSGRRRPVATEEFYNVDCDYLIEAIGEAPELECKSILTDHGYIKASSSYLTNIEGIYTIGDITLGAKTVVEACMSGKMAAQAIINQDNNEKGLEVD